MTLAPETRAVLVVGEEDLGPQRRCPACLYLWPEGPEWWPSEGSRCVACHRARKRRNEAARRIRALQGPVRVMRPSVRPAHGRPCPGDGARGCLATIPADRERCEFCRRTMAMGA